VIEADTQLCSLYWKQRFRLRARFRSVQSCERSTTAAAAMVRTVSAIVRIR